MADEALMCGHSTFTMNLDIESRTGESDAI